MLASMKQYTMYVTAVVRAVVGPPPFLGALILGTDSTKNKDDPLNLQFITFQSARKKSNDTKMDYAKEIASINKNDKILGNQKI